jgi:hypothetical protein
MVASSFTSVLIERENLTEREGFVSRASRNANRNRLFRLSLATAAICGRRILSAAFAGSRPFAGLPSAMTLEMTLDAAALVDNFRGPPHQAHAQVLYGACRCRRRVSGGLERIDEAHAFDFSPVLEIFRKDDRDASIARGGPDEGVPERQTVSARAAVVAGPVNANTSPRSCHRETATRTSETGVPRRSEVELNSLRHCALSTSSPLARSWSITSMARARLTGSFRSRE